MDSIIFNGKEFRKYNNTYYVSADGEIFSQYAKKIIKPALKGKEKKYLYIDIYKNGKQRHTPIHRIVYESWVRPLTEGEQVNHKDDNQLNNSVDNLYVGSQKENISDCISNNHRIGNMFYLTVYDKQSRKVLTFAPANKFIAYCGHPNKSGSLNKFFTKNWFKKRYEILDFKRIKNIDELKGVTTMGDECNPVE